MPPLEIPLTLPDSPHCQAALDIIRALREAGHQAWFVGGCVRDRLLGLPLKDVDIATAARPQEIHRLLAPSRLVGTRFAVTMVDRPEGIFEVATFRHDGAYLDHRHPSTVRFGTLEEDAARRDFTINALYFDPLSGEIRDFHGGLQDLEAGIVRCVGDPNVRFREDALRLLRCIRFACRFDFGIERQTWQALFERAPLIDHVSPERHRDELTRILTSPGAARGVHLMAEAGLLYFLLPELLELKGIEQGRGPHPEGDAWAHTLLVLEKVEPRTPVNCWAALLHDIGKAPTFHRDAESGRITFHRHQQLGAEIAAMILTRLRFPNEEREAIVECIARHMDFVHVCKMRESTLRRWLSSPTIEHDLALHRADCLGSNGRLDYWEFCRRKLEELRERQEEALPPPLVSGHDLLAMGWQPGPALGRALQRLQDMQMDGEVTTREEALAVAEHWRPAGGRE